MTDLILFGMQGSGKGTQGQLLSEKYGYKIFDTGSELRRIVASGNALGTKIKTIIDAGHLVPTEVVIEIVADFLTNIPRETPIIFDGIPRSEEQRVLFETEMGKHGRTPVGLHIHLTEDEAVSRLTGRTTCNQCKKIYGKKDNLQSGDTCPACGGTLATRADDTEAAIRTRLGVFSRETLPVIEWYRGANRLIEVEGKLPVAEVTTLVEKKLQQKQ